MREYQSLPHHNFHPASKAGGSRYSNSEREQPRLYESYPSAFTVRLPKLSPYFAALKKAVTQSKVYGTESHVLYGDILL